MVREPIGAAFVVDREAACVYVCVLEILCAMTSSVSLQKNISTTYK